MLLEVLVVGESKPLGTIKSAMKTVIIRLTCLLERSEMLLPSGGKEAFHLEIVSNCRVLRGKNVGGQPGAANCVTAHFIVHVFTHC